MRPDSEVTGPRGQLLGGQPRARPNGGNPYNGYSWKERMAKYVEMQRQVTAGVLTQPRGPCGLCGDPGHADGRVIFEYHDEDYSRPYSWAEPAAFVVCESCHRRLHMRFKHPEAWRAFVAHVRRGGYARDLHQPVVKAEVDSYRQSLKNGQNPVALRPMRPHLQKQGEWFDRLSMDWEDMSRACSRPRP